MAAKKGRWREALKWFEEVEKAAPRSKLAADSRPLLDRAARFAPVESNAVALRAMKYDELLQAVTEELDAAQLEALAQAADALDAARWQVPARVGQRLVALDEWISGCRWVRTAAGRARNQPALVEAAELCRVATERGQAEAAAASAFAAGDPRAGPQYAQAASLGSTDYDGLLEGALVLGNTSDWARASSVLEHVIQNAPAPQVARAKWLVEHFSRLRQLEDRADAARGARPAGGLPATQLAGVLQQIDQWAVAAQTAANQYADAAQQRAQRKEQEVRRLEESLSNLQYDFEFNSNAAADAERDASQYASGAYGIGGTVSAQMRARDAAEYRAKAEGIRQSMLTLQQLLEGARRAWLEDQ